MSQTSTTPPYTMERATFSARETELVWTYGFGFDAVWEAVNSAATRTGLTLVSMDRQVGMSVAKPPFSLFNFGRRIAITFLKQGDEATQVRAVYLHGISLLGRHSRQETLEALLRTALSKLDRPEPRPAPKAQSAPPKPPATEQPESRTAASTAAQQDEAATPRSGAHASTESNAAAQPAAQSSTTQAAAAPTPGAQPSAPQPAGAASRPATQTPPTGRTTPGEGAGPAAPRAPRSDDGVHLSSMDFRHMDFDDLPLTPPTGAEARRFLRRPPLQRSSGFGRTAGWFLLGLALAALAFVLSGGLSLFFRP